MSRSDLERYFVMSGGMAFRDHTNYVYRKCGYIRVEVDFSPDPAVEREFSPNDVVTKTSKLFIDYPSKD